MPKRSGCLMEAAPVPRFGRLLHPRFLPWRASSSPSCVATSKDAVLLRMTLGLVFEVAGGGFAGGDVVVHGGAGDGAGDGAVDGAVEGAGEELAGRGGGDRW